MTPEQERVLRAAEKLVMIARQFEDDTKIIGEYLDQLDTAMTRCSGTAPYDLDQEWRKQLVKDGLLQENTVIECQIIVDPGMPNETSS